MAYSEVIEKPESIQDANRFVKGRMWSFLGAAILVLLRFILAYIVGVIALALLGGLSIVVIITALSAVLGDSGTIIGTIISILIYIALFVLFFGYLIRLFASFSASELFLSKEENVNASEALKQSRELTKGHLTNLVLIYFIASLVSFPLLGIIFTIQILPVYIQDSYPILSSEIFRIFQFVFNIITTTLKVRREGMGLDLRK